MSATRATTRPKLLAVSSGGGHWVELLRLREGFVDCDVTYVSVHPAYRNDVGDAPFLTVNDATRWDKFGLLLLALRIFWIMVRVRPDAVVSTGAAPGFFALRLARLFGAKTLWVDSLANIDEVSLSGARIAPHVDLALTQWKHLVSTPGFSYGGSILSLVGTDGKPVGESDTPAPILVTVGAQMPFDRLIRAVEGWAMARGRNDLFFQVGEGGYRPAWGRSREMLDSVEFRQLLRECRAVVAHAGTGSILSALEACKPIVVMPRRYDLLETRNDHQFATAERFREMGRVAVAMDESELPALLDRLDEIPVADRIASTASPELLGAVRDFIHRRGEFAPVIP